MSVEQSIYIGPYMVVKRKKVETFYTVMLCKTESCSKFDKIIKSTYCSECGTKPTAVKKPKTDLVTASDIIQSEESEDFNDDLYFPHAGGVDMFEDRDVILPNDTEGRPGQYKIDERGSDTYPILKGDADADMEWFKRRFDKEIKLLEREFGQDNIEYNWGLVVSWS